MQSLSSVKRHSVAMLLITLLGFSVRVIHLGGDSFWFDELWTLDATHDDVATIAAGQDLNNPPGYHLGAYGAVQLAGVSEYALRFPSALAGTLTIPLIYVVGCILMNRRVGWWAALLLAVSPFHIRYSQEARAYALQAMFTMLSTASLLSGLVRHKRVHWLSFGVATALNAYTQFSAFVVLGCQLAFAGLYGLIEWLRKAWSTRRVIASAAGGVVGLLVAAVIYSPYLSAAWAGVSANLGRNAWAGDWSSVTIYDRLSIAYQAFGFMDGTLAAVMGGLAVLGVLRAIGQRRIDLVSWLLISCLLPFVVIAVSGVSRAPLAKNVLFVLPAYLLAAALGLDAIVDGAKRLVRQRPGFARAMPVAATGFVLILGAVTVPIEHARTEEDWRSIAAHLDQAAGQSPVIVPVTLDLPDGFNQGYAGLAHYLREYPFEHFLLQGGYLTDPSVADLAGAKQSGNEVWFAVLKRDTPLKISAPDIEVIPFQGGSYLVHPRRFGRPPLDVLIETYPLLIAQARTPCYLWLDVARLNMEQDHFEAASAALDRFSTPCPNSFGTQRLLYQRQIDYYLQTNALDRARTLARQLLALDSKDRIAQVALTIFDLTELYHAEDNRVTAQPSSAKPIEVLRFEMPQSGDWGDALVMQTPAHVSFRLQLPDEPAQFATRIAMFPESWNWGGDGARFSVNVQGGPNQSAKVYERYVSNAQPDQTWHEVDISLAAYAGQSITLTLETDPGPNGDTTGDWAGWDSPRIVYASADIR